MKEKTFEEEVKAAEKRVASMDKIDGFKDRKLFTIQLALECGLKSPQTGAQYEAFVMLMERASKEREEELIKK